MAKSRSFSIYLLKDAFDHTNSLKKGHGMLDSVSGSALPDGATLYVLDNMPKPPWWKNYFQISKSLDQVQKGAIVFLPVKTRVFAITFGHVYHNLIDTCYEYDFGLLVTLNSLDPDKLKSTDILEPSGAKRQRTQVPTASDLTYFDIDQDTTILKSLTGKVKPEYEDIFKHATGSSNIRVSTDVAPSDLPDLCEKLLTLYADTTYKTTFPDIQNICPVRDPLIIEQLDANLLSEIQAKNHSISLSIPEILNYQDGFWAIFSGAGSGLIYDDVFIDRYYQYLADQGVILSALKLDDLKNHKLNPTDEEGNPRGTKHSVYKCLIADVTLSATSSTYHLCEGNWYLVEKDFVKNLQDFLDPFFEDCPLPAFNHANEADYNSGVSAGNADYACLDTTSIAPKGQRQVEPCDIFEACSDHAVLHHIKISTQSDKLSHLFNQGANSIHLLRDKPESVTRLNDLTQAEVSPAEQPRFVASVATENFKLKYGIVTHKDPTEKSLNFPLFSRISLMRVLKDMKRMRIDAAVYFIDDKTVSKPGKTKPRKSKTPKKPQSGTES